MKRLTYITVFIILLVLGSIVSADERGCDSNGRANVHSKEVRGCDTEDGAEHPTSNEQNANTNNGASHSQIENSGKGGSDSHKANSDKSASDSHVANSGNGSSSSQAFENEEDIGIQEDIIPTDYEIPHEALYLQGGCFGFIRADRAVAYFRITGLFSLHGCFVRIDEDGDGVPNWIDDCPGTSEDAIVGPNGCPLVPDLTITITTGTNLAAQTCPVENECVLTIPFTVTNIGMGNVVSSFDIYGENSAGGTGTFAVTGGLAAGESISSSIDLGPAPNCCDADGCEATLTVDINNTVEETNESNNTATESWFFT